MMVKRICGFVLVFVAFGLSQARAQTGSFERTLQVSGPVSLEVASGAGNIVVHTGAGGGVHVLGKIQAHDSLALDFWTCWWGPSAPEQIHQLELHPPIEQQGDTIRIGKNDQLCQISIDYALTVPAQTGLAAHSGSGEVSIDGLQLPSSAATGSGNITVENIGGDLHLSSGSGDLSAASVKGALYAHTGSGRIRAVGMAGEITAATGSGGVDIQQVAAGNVNIRTASGRVNLRGIQGGLRVKTASGGIQVEGAPQGNWEIRSVSGNIGLETPSQIPFNFDLQTLSGNLRAGRPLTVQGLVSRNHLRGTTGNGGMLLEARTVSGNIELF